ncbi:MAG TPA: hypothetical protein VK400_15895, partial [Pyrinomonadaceae bacterium]|nr:hypothetical protein [Pyrinomonadaceae bacterium]
DTTFTPRLENHGTVEKSFSLSDGKTVIIGRFDKIGNAERKNIARINADGTPDAPINLPENVSTYFLEPLPNGKFIALTTDRLIVRLNADGSLDYSFNFARTILMQGSLAFKARSDGKVFVYGKFKVKRGRQVIAENLIVLDEIGGIESGYTVGNYGSISSVTFLPDGKTAVSGLFEVKRDGFTVGRNFAVLDEHGLIDRNFDVVFDAGPHGLNETVTGVVAQPDGKLLVYGYFKTAYKQNGISRTFSKNKGILRLNADGTFDRDFSLPFVAAAVGQAIVQPDGKILLYAGLQLTPDVYIKFINRLFPDGSLDNSFNDNMPLAGAHSHGGTSDVRLLPDGKILVRGHYRVNDSPNVEKLIRLNQDGTHDSSFQTPAILGGSLTGAYNLPDGKILILGYFGRIGNRTRIGLARLNADGSTDETFRLDAVESDGVGVGTLSLQPDGKIIIARGFTVVNGEYIFNPGHANNVSQQSFGVVMRLNQDGSVDDSFVPFNNVYSQIHAIVLQTDGKILISGIVWNLIISTYITRLNPDGTVDASFNRTLFIQSNPYPQIYDIAVQADGKILVGGYFSQVGQPGNPPQYKLARLKQDGTLDESLIYNGYYHHLDSIRKIAVQTDGKILVGGEPLGSAGTAPGLARFNRDGTLDAAFKWNRELVTEYTYDFQISADGKILYAGTMGIGLVGNVLPHDLYRLNRNGDVETAFNLSQVTKFLLQADGKIVAQVQSQTLPGVRLKRVFSDGAPDNTFNFTLDRKAYNLVQQPDGKILLAGEFTTVNGVRQAGLARLTP